MRLVATLIVVALAAGCGKTKASGPAWPAPSTTAEDGGESLEPQSTTVATSLEKADDKTEVDKAPAAAAEPTDKPAAATEAEKPATVTPPTQPTSDEVIMSEEIIIEIDE